MKRKLHYSLDISLKNPSRGYL